MNTKLATESRLLRLIAIQGVTQNMECLDDQSECFPLGPTLRARPGPRPRVRWALEEAGLPYEARLIGPDDQKSESYRAMQPFGQVPAFEDDNLVLFESEPSCCTSPSSRMS